MGLHGAAQCSRISQPPPSAMPEGAPTTGKGAYLSFL